jgi:hypothetical protein
MQPETEAAIDELESKALKVLVEHEAISECDVHKGVYLDNGDPEAVSKAYAAAAEMVSSGEIEATKEKFMAAIGSVLADSSEDCPQCEEQGEDED